MSDQIKIPRRSLLVGIVSTVSAIATFALTYRVQAQTQTKVSKSVAKYQDHPKGEQRCEICINFQPPNQCQFVSGNTAPKGWCQFFAAREKAQ
jgi:hypothetical protein